ncbi:hypothetical protein H2200_008241 [Cladophialophora chaetospira]|uniref:Uncharacterized protein n=1 Tax=Cladophialophora chaetospira TaxID=386627 RepID=A0AA38X5S4_9EURO|nr:hypothetical protein H2200_008241 [Cladophialophora chaetospira]
MVKVARFFLSPLSLIIRTELCIVGAFVLSIIALCAGRWPGPIEGFAILTVDSSSLANATSPGALPINDWYDAHYLSICTGMWNHHTASMGKNHSTTVCWLQSTGYTFSIANFVGNKDAQQAILDHQPPLKTMVPFVLLVLSIVSMGISIVAFLHGVIMMVRHEKTPDAVMRGVPLLLLRIAFSACIATNVFKMISSAKITVSASKSSGTFDIFPGKNLHAWRHDGFLVITWVSVGLVWIAIGLMVVAAFRLAPMLKKQERQVAGADRRWYRL